MTSTYDRVPRWLRGRRTPLCGLRKGWTACQRQLLALGVSLCLAFAGAACGVTRAPIDSRSDPAALPNLRRASQALQERIVREKEHVTGLNQQLAELRASEARVYSEVFEAEAAYQRLRADADDVQVDVSAVRGELEDLRRTLESGLMERKVVGLELAALEADLVAQRQAGLEARREIAVRRGKLDLEVDRTGLRPLSLEELRVRWEVPAREWAQLWNDLGLWEQLEDASHASSQPLPPDSLPPPGGTSAGSGEGAEDNSEGDTVESP